MHLESVSVTNDGDERAEIRERILTWSREAFGERVARVASVAHANRAVVDHLALRAQAARAPAGGRALLINARELQGALVVHHALWSTVRWVSHEIREAGAHGVIIQVPTLAVRAAGGGAAGV